ncbi:MAG: hypothetical protein RLZZ338_92 [Cyanobacteriota bacterium]|jgi:multidrug resistance efflux pump
MFMPTVSERKASLRISQAKERQSLKNKQKNDMDYLNNTWDTRIVASKKELDNLKANKKTAKTQLKTAQVNEKKALAIKQKNDLAAIK